MTNYRDYDAILAVIGHGIDKARKNPKPDEPDSSDDYVAWVILQEFRRAGWSIIRTPSPDHPSA